MDPATGAAIAQAASSVIGAGISAFSGKNNHAGRDQRQATSYANYSAIADKVRAAKASGIHPLYALGAPTISAASAVGSPGQGPDLGRTFSEMGQDVSRAVAATQTEAERLLQTLTLEKAGLENDYLRSQIASVRTRTMREAGVSMPSPEKIVAPQRTSSVRLGNLRPTNRNVSDAQTIEDRHGELAGSLWGAVTVPADMWQMAKDWWKNPATWADWPF